MLRKFEYVNRIISNGYQMLNPKFELPKRSPAKSAGYDFIVPEDTVCKSLRILGFGSHGYNEEIEYISDISEPYNPFGEDRKFYLSDLTQYKTFKEAQNAAKKLNNMPENKKRFKRWIRDKFSQEILEFKYRREI